MYDMILKKKHGLELSDGEIRSVIKDYTNALIPDYQMSALLMAICFRGMSDKETATLTDAIAASGDSIDLSEFGSLSVDKHSTGGVGDKTTLIVAPLAAAMGCKVAKMSGRGLGHTGGTVDKLESIPGYSTSLTPNEFFSQVRRVGVCVMGQSGNLAPADKKIYALRDVTATVDSIPLITSSVMGKKLAAGASSIVLDVKYGSGSFMKSAEDAEILAEKMVEIGRRCNRRMAALITYMDTPLGHAIGNSLEVIEAIETLRGEGPEDLTEICLSLSAAMAQLSLGLEYGEAYTRAKSTLLSGEAYAKFKEWIAAQGADVSFAEHPDKFKKAEYSYSLTATSDGYVYSTDTEALGLAAVELGAGRKTKDDPIDHAAGIILLKKTGDSVKTGDVIATLLTNDESTLCAAKKIITEAITVKSEAPKTHALIHKVIGCDGVKVC